MDFAKLFNTDYLFQIAPSAGFDLPMRIVLYFIFIAAIVIAVMAGKKIRHASGIMKKVWYKLQVWGWSSGIFGLLLVSFRELGAIYLSQRFWLFMWILFIFLWLLYIVYYWKKVVPQKEAKKQESAEFDKWLPKKKK